MYATATATERRRRIDHDYREPSPSPGSRDIFAVMEATVGLGDPEPRATVENDDYLKDFSVFHHEQ